MSRKKTDPFEFLDHTGDIRIIARGKNLAEAFENAALAMFETMTYTKNVQNKIDEIVEVQGHDKIALLYNWLEDLLIRFDIGGTLYSRFRIEKIEESKKGFKLKAKIFGESFNRGKHKQKVGVKAITYHQMSINEKKGECLVEFILDI